MLEEHQFYRIASQFLINIDKTVTACKHYQILIATSFEIFQSLKVIAVINDSLKDKFIFSKCSSFIESYNICFPTQRYFLWLTDKNLLFLEIKNRVIDCQIKYHRQLRRDYCRKNQNTT